MAGRGGEQTETVEGEIEGSRTGVCGFQCVQSVVVFLPHCFRDCGLPAEAPRHTHTHIDIRTLFKSEGFRMEKHAALQEEKSFYPARRLDGCSLPVAPTPDL